MTYNDQRLPDTFWSKVIPEPTTGCWLWTGALNWTGYGQFWWMGKTRQAHCVSFRHLVGDVPDGLELDHICRQPCCVNPGHIRPMTRKENIARTLQTKAQRGKCRAGHPWTTESMRVEVRESEGGRMVRRCLVCRREANQSYRERRNADG